MNTLSCDNFITHHVIAYTQPVCHASGLKTWEINIMNLNEITLSDRYAIPAFKNITLKSIHY